MDNEELLEFGIKRENEERRDGGCCVAFYPETQKYAVYKHPRSNALCLFGGGFDEGEDERNGCLRELKEESGLFDFLHDEKIDKVICHYYNRNKGIYRVAHATCFLVVLNSDKKENLKLEDHENDFEHAWGTYEEILMSWKDNNQNEDYGHWIHFLEKANKKLEELGFKR